MLLEHHADVQAKDRDGLTPLHFAAWRCRVAVGRLLLQKGADVNAREKQGMTPLQWGLFERGVERGAENLNEALTDAMSFIKDRAGRSRKRQESKPPTLQGFLAHMEGELAHLDKLEEELTAEAEFERLLREYGATE